MKLDTIYEPRWFVTYEAADYAKKAVRQSGLYNRKEYNELKYATWFVADYPVDPPRTLNLGGEKRTH